MALVDINRLNSQAEDNAMLEGLDYKGSDTKLVLTLINLKILYAMTWMIPIIQQVTSGPWSNTVHQIPKHIRRLSKRGNDSLMSVPSLIAKRPNSSSNKIDSLINSPLTIKGEIAVPG